MKRKHTQNTNSNLFFVNSTDVQLLCKIVIRFINAYTQFLYLYNCAPVTNTHFTPQLGLQSTPRIALKRVQKGDKM